jgi:hypothetical protein
MLEHQCLVKARALLNAKRCIGDKEDELSLYT